MPLTRLFPLPGSQRAFLAGVAVVAGISGLAAPGRGQEAPLPSPSEPPEDLFFESIDVNVVNVDVYVTDKQGNRVTDLTRGDFELFEDGKPVKISNFYSVVGGRPQEGAPIESLPPQAAPAPLSPIGIPDDQRLYVVVYFDNLFLRPFSRNKVIDYSRRFLLNELSEEDQVMLVTFERSLHVRRPFTANKQEILEEMEELRKLSAFAPQQQSERREVIRRLDQSRDSFEAAGHVDFYAKSIYNDMLMTINSLKEMVSSLAGLPGRKALLYLSDGLPLTAGEDLFFLIDEKFQDQNTSHLASFNYRAKRQFNELTARANANRVSFYTIEAAGLTSHSSLSAEYGHRDTSIIEADVMHDANREEPLLLMADATGGLSAVNTNNFNGAFDAISKDFSNYYSLGYAPSHATAGRYYKIEVRVKRPGVAVRHRAGYRDKSPENRVNEGTLAALIHGTERNSLGVRLQFAAEKPSTKGNYLLPVEVRIPLGRVTLIPQEGSHRGAVRLSLGVIDDEGRISPLHQASVPILVPAADLDRAKTQDFIYEVELLMRRGIQGVAVGVYDDFAGDSAFIRQTVRVGA